MKLAKVRSHEDMSAFAAECILEKVKSSQWCRLVLIQAGHRQDVYWF
jgi:hypothetical protein